MTKEGHQLTGFGAALLAAATVSQFPGGLPVLAAIFAMAGTTAPDWLEIAWYDRERRCRRSLITHRTWTHWLPLWLIALVYCFVLLVSSRNMLLASCLTGFVFGGLMHLAVDVPNPTGIPVIYPRKRRFSFKLWRSDENVIPFTVAVWAVCIGLSYFIAKEEVTTGALWVKQAFSTFTQLLPL